MKKMKPAWKNRISMNENESDIDKKIRKHVKPLEEIGLIWSFHVTDTRRSTPGIPDRNYLIRNPRKLYYLMAELKSPQGTGDLTEGQKKLIAFLKGSHSGSIIYLITNDADEVIEMIDTILEDRLDD